MNLKAILNSATMGQPKRLRPMILWTILEYFFRGAPYGITLYVVWELFKPLEYPGTEINTSKIIIACIGFLLSIALLFIFSRKAYFSTYKDGYEISAEGRKDITNFLRKLPMGFYNKRDPGDIGAYILSDYAYIEAMVTHIVPQFFGALSMPLALIIGLAFFNWKLALIAALVIPFSLPFTKLTRWIMSKVGVKHQKIKINASSRMIEYIQGIKLIKSFNLGGIKFERLEKSFRDLKNQSIKVEAVPAPVLILASAILNAGIVLIILIGFSMLLKTQITLPVYIMFLVLGTHIYQPLMHAMMFLAEFNYLELGAERIEKLRETPLLPEGDESKTIKDYEIEFKNVVFSYNNTNVINNLSTTIPSQKLTALVGPSGSGKTTLTRLIARFWDVDKGEIRIGSENIKSYNSDYLISNISIVFQDVYLFNDTIYNNIRIGKETASKEEVIAAAKAAQCHDFIVNMPEQYDTIVGEGGSTLSGGEKQRISIARAILKDAPIILLDEATASLDPENELYIQKAINDLVKNKTVIVIAHRLNTVRKADKIIVLDKGELVEEGKHDDLIQIKGLYYSLWQEQQRIKGWKFKE